MARETDGQKRSVEDQAVLLLINGMSQGEVERFCQVKGEQSEEEARQTVAEARKRITIAADVNRDEKFGTAVMRLEDLYGRAIRTKDARTALAAQRELNRLLDLYGARADPDAAPPAADDGASDRLAVIEGYLLPLELTDAHYPIEEHARVAAEVIRSKKAEGGGKDKVT